MALYKIIEVVCDHCRNTIHHGIEVSKREAWRDAVADGAVSSKGKHYCDKSCREDARMDAGRTTMTEPKESEG